MKKKRKPDVTAQLAKALRMQAKFNDVADKDNCWCGPAKHMGSVACVTARRALAAYRRASQHDGEPK